MTDKAQAAKVTEKQRFTLPIAVRIGAVEVPKGAEVELYPDQIARIEAMAKRNAGIAGEGQ